MAGYPDAAIFDRTSLASPVAYPASRTALLLVDFYASFQNHLPQGEFDTIVERAAALRTWALSKDILVVHAMIDLRGSSDVLYTHKSAARLIGFQKAMIGCSGAEKEPSALAYPGVAEAGDQETFVLRKPGTYNAMPSRGLVEELEKRGIRSLIVGGIATSAGVMSTLRAAADEGYIMTIPKDACGDPDQVRHDVLIERVIPSLAHVTTVEELAAQWDKE